MPSGSCVCGAVAFEVEPPYRFFQYCHWSRCRKRSGSIHAANIAVLSPQLVWLRGRDHVQAFELASASAWGNAFCSTCGAGLPWLTRNGRAYIVPAGALDDDPVERPTRNVQMSSRAAWEVPASSLPDFVPPERWSGRTFTLKAGHMVVTR
jgi:hypothetical protein